MSKICDLDRWAWRIRDSVLLTELSSVVPAMKICQNVRGILGTLNSQYLFTTSVCGSVQIFALGGTDESPGFMTKIKKLLETVCHNCGKILVDEVSHPLRDGRSCPVYFADALCFRAIQRLRMPYVAETQRNASTWSGGFANLR